MKNLFLGIVFLVSSPLAYGHTGHASSFFEASIHPILGWDHLLAMFMVGIVAYHRTRQKSVADKSGARSALLFPLSFMSAMTVGFIIALNSTVSNVLFENGVLLSVFVMSLMVLRLNVLRRFPFIFILGFIVIFGVAHGLAHGVELEGNEILLALGMLVGTSLLHGAGFLFGYRLAHRPLAYKSAGVIGIAASALSMGGVLS